MIFNNTNTTTQTRRIHGQPYTNPRGGLLILIHQNYAFPGNITKIPLTTNISPYLQIIKITNHPLSTYFIINLYMPTYIEDISLISIIQTTIFNHIHNNPLSNIIMLRDFNRDITWNHKNSFYTTRPRMETLHELTPSTLYPHKH
jgi:hypothetical protein